MADDPKPDESMTLPDNVLKDAVKKFEEPNFIIKVENYYSHTGIRIDKHILVDGSFPPDFAIHVGHGSVAVPAKLPPGMRLPPGVPHPTQREPVNVPLPQFNDETDIIKVTKAAIPIVEQACKDHRERVMNADKDQAASAALRRRLTEGLRG